MGESYMGSNGRLVQSESGSPHVKEGHDAGHITIQDAIRLTARFESEWFRSPRTLDEDLARFAAVYRLNDEEVQQVRRVMEALSEGAGAGNLEVPSSRAS